MLLATVEGFRIRDGIPWVSRLVSASAKIPVIQGILIETRVATMFAFLPTISTRPARRRCRASSDSRAGPWSRVGYWRQSRKSLTGRKTFLSLTRIDAADHLGPG
jgi:hypothetical protein